MNKILIIEDENLMLEFMSATFAPNKQIEVCGAKNFKEGMVALENEEFSLVITDMKLPDGDGLDIVGRVKLRNQLIEVIVVTAYGTVETAVKAMRLGAADFITKPFSVEELETAVEKALEHRDLVLENRFLRREISKKYDFSRLIGTSKKLKQVFSIMSSVVESDIEILITGESGTGKDLVAKTIHFNSPRATHPFLPINCSALPESLLESELFGHRRGAFTGAVKDKLGLLMAANGGTIFLDEIGELSPTLQVKLLRFIENKEVLPVGATKPVNADVRVITATNRNLEEAVKQNMFREDLFYRLHVVPIHLPPLRDRREDIIPLADFFVENLCRDQGQKRKTFSQEAFRQLELYPWPGNIRELENVLRRAVTLSKGVIISSRDLNLGETPLPEGVRLTAPLDLEAYLAQEEQKYIREALLTSGGVKARAARLLGLKRTTLVAKMRKYELDSTGE